MPGRKKKTSRALLAVTVFLCLALSGLMTKSAADPVSARNEAMPDIIVADSAAKPSPVEKTLAKEAPREEPDAAPAPKGQKDLDFQVSRTEPSAKDEPKPQGVWTLRDGEWYYQVEDLYKTGWLRENGHWYYFHPDGRMAVGWVSSGNDWYYTDEDGIMQTGWILAKDQWYYLDKEGIMETGWLHLDGQWYYFQQDGSMQTGWLDLGGQWYYLGANGAMATGWVVVSGEYYFLREDGVWDPAKAPDASMLPDAPEGAMVALTFDDGPGMYTDRLLNALEANGAKATFFMVGENIPDYPSTISRMEALGCELGNHTGNHLDLTTLQPDQIRSEVQQVNDALTNIVGHGATLVRPPYGAIDDASQAQVTLPMVLWTVDTLDWKTLDIQKTLESVFGAVKDGDIILMHDIHETSVAAAEILIPALADRGYQLVTVSELAAAKGISLEAGTVYREMTSG